jgi:hypothetical protein
MHHSIMWNTSAVLVLIMFLVVEVKGFSPHLLQSRTRTRTEYTTTRTHRHTDTAEPVAPSEQIVQKSNGFELAAEVVDPVLVSDEWELDFYSRPVIDEKGKKLWEVLLCDKSGNYRVARNMPSNLVNSRELRRVVQEVRNLLRQDIHSIHTYIRPREHVNARMYVRTNAYTHIFACMHPRASLHERRPHQRSCKLARTTCINTNLLYLRTRGTLNPMRALLDHRRGPKTPTSDPILSQRDIQHDFHRIGRHGTGGAAKQSHSQNV